MTLISYRPINGNGRRVFVPSNNFLTKNNMKMNLIPHRTYANKWVDDLIDNFFSRPLAGFDSREVMYNSRPSVNIREEEQEFVIELASPGLKKADFTLKVEDGMLVVGVEKEQKSEDKEEGKYFRREFNFASFERKFQLPETIDAEKISAAYTDGILSVHLPKVEEVKDPVKTIQIQ